MHYLRNRLGQIRLTKSNYPRDYILNNNAKILCSINAKFDLSNSQLSIPTSPNTC